MSINEKTPVGLVVFNGSYVAYSPDYHRIINLDSIFDDASITSGSLFKNRIINGDFRIHQRGNIFSFANNGGYTSDRWYSEIQGGSITVEAFKTTNSSNVLDIFGDGSCTNMYQFNGNALDLSGIGNGTWHGTESYTIAKWDLGANFNGSSYVDATINQTSVMTVSFWFKVNAQTKEALFYFAANDLTKIVGLYYWGDSTPKMFGFNTWQSNCYGVIVPDDFASSDFIHVVAEFHFGSIFSNRLWINGVEQTLSDLRNPTTKHGDGSNYIRFAAGNSTSNQMLNGILDQVRIFNRTLTNSEIQQLYTEAKTDEVPNKKYLSVKLDNKTAITKFIPFRYRFEGQHLYDLVQKGSKVTLSFDFKSSKAGTYSIAFINKTDDSNIETYLASFNYKNVNSWERMNVTIPLSEFQTPVNNDNNLGFELIIAGLGDTGSEGLNNGEVIQVSNALELEVDDTIWLSNVQLEEGEKATDFEYVPYEIQELRCKRYYRKSLSNVYNPYDQIIEMRTSPTIIGMSSPYGFDAEL